MEIYVAHTRSFNFQEELYKPIRLSSLNNKHNFILPHEHTKELFNSKDYLKNKCDLVIAEVSFPRIGLGIELGWADLFGVPIVCVYKKGSRLSGSLREVSSTFIKYSSEEELISGIEDVIKQIQNK